MLMFCIALIFKLIFMTYCMTDMCWIEDKKSHLKHVLHA